MLSIVIMLCGAGAVANLIVEFAEHAEREGKSACDAALEAAAPPPADPDRHRGARRHADGELLAIFYVPWVGSGSPSHAE